MHKRGISLNFFVENFLSDSGEKMYMNLMCFTDFGYR